MFNCALHQMVLRTTSLYYSNYNFCSIVRLWYDIGGKNCRNPYIKFERQKVKIFYYKMRKKKKKKKNLISTLLNNNYTNCLRWQEYIGNWLKAKICISNLLTLVLSHCLLYVRGLWVMTTKYHFNTEPRKRNIMNIFVNNKTKSRTQSNNLHNSLN